MTEPFSIMKTAENVSKFSWGFLVQCPYCSRWDKILLKKEDGNEPTLKIKFCHHGCHKQYMMPEIKDSMKTNVHGPHFEENSRTALKKCCLELYIKKSSF